VAVKGDSKLGRVRGGQTDGAQLEDAQAAGAERLQNVWQLSGQRAEAQPQDCVVHRWRLPVRAQP
jgi:hypothetical protein